MAHIETIHECRLGIIRSTETGRCHVPRQRKDRHGWTGESVGSSGYVNAQKAWVAVVVCTKKRQVLVERGQCELAHRMDRIKLCQQSQLGGAQ